MKHTTAKAQLQNPDVLTWLQIHNLFPIIIGILSVSAAYWILKGDVALQGQQLDYTRQSVQQSQAQVNTLQNKIQQEEVVISTLQDHIQAVKGASTKNDQTVSLTPSPTKGVSR